jgi:broad specificity phosphatase PhoE
MNNPAQQEVFANLYMVRHGESTCNTVNRIAGCLDAPLTLLGRAQATKAAKSECDVRFDIVYASPLSRAYQTAQIIADAHDVEKTSIRSDTRLIERDFGSYTLENKSILQRRHGVVEYERAMNADSETMRDGETFGQFQARVQEFFDQELVPWLREGKTVLVVSHKYVIEYICRLILDGPGEEGYDLRLPNSQILRGDKIRHFIKDESKWRNMFYDWLVVKHATIFVLAILVGLLVNLSGVRTEASPWIMLALLVVATAITMCRIEVESIVTYTKSPEIVRNVFLRYLAVPTVGAIAVAAFDGATRDFAYNATMIVAAPAAISVLTVSRCLGGLVMPSLAYVGWSSLATIVPISILLSLGQQEQVAQHVLLVSVVSLGSVLIPYLLIRFLRQHDPIRIAKYGERNAHVAVVLLAAFIFLATLRIDLATGWRDGLVSLGIVVLLRVFAGIVARKQGVNALDAYVSMSYPNTFIVIVIAGIVANIEVQQIATWLLLPLFACSVVDGLYARWLVLDPADRRLKSLLGIGEPRDTENGSNRPERWLRAG